jgi:hypothetical protein
MVDETLSSPSSLLLLCVQKLSQGTLVIPIDLIGGRISLMEGTSIFEVSYTKYRGFYKEGEVHIPLSSRTKRNGGGEH